LLGRESAFARRSLFTADGFDTAHKEIMPHENNPKHHPNKKPADRANDPRALNGRAKAQPSMSMASLMLIEHKTSG